MPLPQETLAWLTEQAGVAPRNHSIWKEALTHGSMGEDIDYQRLEFFGDRVLGLAIAEWLYEQNQEAEGKLSQRLNALVSRQSCAHVAREIGLPAHIRLGKQARADGGLESDNILGDIVESLIGACQREHGFEVARDMVRRWFADALEGRAGRSKHPKSALQEWAAGNRRKPPEYELIGRDGPDHAARFTVRVSVHKVGEATGEGDSKQEAETAAARAFLAQYG
ncbi:ribonuclease III [Croceicoccus naphthovorans]|uniref:Ribonuclease 3 n=1 Tax=Croceicoccus naphthovorans TaxID=1348774 RepID=A0A0G3XJ62_9SPHN|nr:ribonuclease III [Croceicoccus naphthovorans]AKM10423.1 ribonuclease III [Croceicoccus naphthovorans]MBB3990129.1 ribonuclease-3 [Croceicoccus naphthovorans]